MMALLERLTLGMFLLAKELDLCWYLRQTRVQFFRKRWTNYSFQRCYGCLKGKLQHEIYVIVPISRSEKSEQEQIFFISLISSSLFHLPLYYPFFLLYRPCPRLISMKTCLFTCQYLA